MDDVSSIIETLNAKIDKVIGIADQLKASNATLEQEKAQLQATIEQQHHQIEALNEKNKVLKLAKSLTGTNESSDSSEVKLKINELVREIDKCIGLLNR